MIIPKNNKIKNEKKLVFTNLRNKISIIDYAKILNLNLGISKINVDMQKIDKSHLNSFRTVIAEESIYNRLKSIQSF